MQTPKNVGVAALLSVALSNSHTSTQYIHHLVIEHNCGQQARQEAGDSSRAHLHSRDGLDGLLTTMW